MHCSQEIVHEVSIARAVRNLSVEVSLAQLHWLKLDEVGYLAWLKRTMLFIIYYF